MLGTTILWSTAYTLWATVNVLASSEDPFIQYAACPISCSEAGLDPENWSYVHGHNPLISCKNTILFETNVYNDREITLRACSTSSGDKGTTSLKRQVLAFNSTQKLTTGSLDIITMKQGTANPNTTQAESAGQQLDRFLRDLATADHRPINFFAKSGKTLVGVHAGSQIDKQSAANAITQFITRIESLDAQRVAAQYCDDDSVGSEVFGIVVDKDGDFPAVQSVLRDWTDAKCAQGEDTQWKEGKVSILPASSISVQPSNATGGGLFKRATCKYIQAQSGDGCYSLAQRCGITQDQLKSYNGGESFCSNIQVGQYVCCSSGTPPDFSPQPNSDGTCKTYTVKSGDNCYGIGEANKMKSDQIEARNKQTWGWAGCSYIYVGQVICLSTGSPPMPAPIANAVCGPQVNGTKKPSNMSTLASLNPCPLNACCDKWGQCGITSEFCTDTPSSTGAPGTSPPGTNGCISNCGTNIVNKDTAPASFMRIGYYESFSISRPCLRMRPFEIPPGKYTHIHYAFGDISPSFDVDMSKTADLFQEFKQLTGVKKIMSFGGWAFSTEPATAAIFREGVTDAQRQEFARRVVSFIVTNGLDGVDFDWEYPGAPDIPGIPPGSKQDGPNYLAFLKLVRAALPKDKTISIAAPASFWYLKQFPIKEMNEVIDYVVYMTYDIHGQWDYGNTFTNPGCPNGNCLRSQINLTETTSALSMITKAGLSTYKLMMGMPLYGRSFKMSSPGCYTEQCTFTGSESGATKGECTRTGGYISNYEIRKILSDPNVPVKEYSSQVAGDILVYNNDQWVSWMTPTTYNSRTNYAKSLNMGGLSDWAIDLDTAAGDDGSGGSGGSGEVYISPDIFASPSPTIWCIPPCTFILPPIPLSTSTVISRPPITKTFSELYPSIETDTSGVTKTRYILSTDVSTITFPPVTTTEIELWNIRWTRTTDSVFGLTSSIIFPPVTLTQRNISTTIGSTTFRTTGTIYTYSEGPYPTVTGPVPPPPPPPPPGILPSLTVSSGTPKPTCKRGQKCGKPCRKNCTPDLPCIGICDCIGLECPCAVPPCTCIGPGCSGGGVAPDNPSSSCSRKTTVTDCSVGCQVTPRSSTLSTSCYTTTCSKVTVCKSSGTTTTSRTTLACPVPPTNTPWYGDNPDQEVTLGDGGYGGYVKGGTGDTRPPATPKPTYISCSHQNQDPGQGITRAYCVCSSSTFAESLDTQTTPANSCAYTTKPTSTISITKDQVVSTDVPNCQVCTTIKNNMQCNTMSGCIKATPTPTPTPRCITAHTYMQNCVFGGDTMSVQLWDGGKQVCNGGQNKNLASEETVYDIDCGDGASVSITKNGANIHYKAADGYELDVPRTDGHDNNYICGMAGDNRVIRGLELEYVFANDKCGNCPTAQLCDYRSYCKFDGTCK